MVAQILQSARDCLNRNDYAEAESFCQQVLTNEPENSEALKLSGIIAMNTGDFGRAVQAFSRVVVLRPDSASDYYNLGLAYINTGDSVSSAQNLQKSLELQPGLACAYADLCMALTQCGDNEAAISAGEKAVSLLPDSHVAHYNLGRAYDEWKKFDYAIKHYQKAAALFPDHPGIQLSLAVSYTDMGNVQAALECYRKIIELYPEDVEAYRQLARINKFTSPDHKDVRKLKAILSEPWLKDTDKISIYFALGKVYQDCKLYDEAFAYYEQANRLQDVNARFVPEELADYITSIINVSSGVILREKSALGSDSKMPVFIVGVPRSGTSLVEQILSSHQDVFGAGELDWFSNTANNISNNLNTVQTYPQCVVELDKTGIDKLASDYLSYLRSHAGDELMVINKMPGNFLHLALIHILFPNARIIHCRRDPRDSCISMYTEYFPDAVPYSYDLLKLGAFYKQYERIMNHWRSVIPASSMIEIDYENLVKDQVRESRRLVKFIGLEWDDSCVDFHRKSRRVHTASDLQVKRPMYSSSIGRWKHYEKHLEALEQGFQYWD